MVRVCLLRRGTLDSLPNIGTMFALVRPTIVLLETSWVPIRKVCVSFTQLPYLHVHGTFWQIATVTMAALDVVVIWSAWALVWSYRLKTNDPVIIVMLTSVTVGICLRTSLWDIDTNGCHGAGLHAHTPTQKRLADTAARWAPLGHQL
jgi:hypothetical protein